MGSSGDFAFWTHQSRKFASLRRPVGGSQTIAGIEVPAEKDELLALLKPFPAECMRVFPVDRRVGDPRDADAGLIEPLRLTGSLPARNTPG